MPSKLGARNRSSIVIALTVCMPGVAFAQDAENARKVENTARTIYQSGSATREVPTNSVSIQVDELIDVAVADVSQTSIVVGNDPGAVLYRISNTGKGPESFSISVDTQLPGNDFNPNVDAVMVDTNRNGVFDPGVDQPLGSDGFTRELAPGEHEDVFVVTSLPTDAVDRGTSEFRVLARARTGVGEAGTVLAKRGTNGVDAIIGKSGGQGVTGGKILAALAVVTTEKASTIVDPLGGNKAVSGSQITYRLTARAVGSGSARNVRLVDTMPASTSYVSGSLTLDRKTLSDSVDKDQGAITGRELAVDLGTLNGGDTRTMTFTVQID